MPDLTRLGTPPHLRTGPDRSMQGGNCPDVFTDGEHAYIIGTVVEGHAVDALGLPGDASVGAHERLVRLPLGVLRDAARNLHATEPRVIADMPFGRLNPPQMSHEDRRVVGCSCGGLHWHEKRCTIWAVDRTRAQQAIDEARGRAQAHTDMLNRRLRAYQQGVSE